MYDLSNIKYGVKINKDLRDFICDKMMIVFFNFMQAVVELSRNLVIFRFLLTIKNQHVD